MKLGIISATVIATGIGVGSIGATCKAEAPAITLDIAEEAVCVISYDKDPPQQIVAECGGMALNDVETILAADDNATKFAGDGGVPTATSAKKKK